MRKILLLIILALPGAFTVQTAYAWNCSVATATSVITPPTLVVQRDLPVGAMIGSVLTSDMAGRFSCSDAPAPALTYQEFGIKSHGKNVTIIDGRNIYSTGIAGIGYAFGGLSGNNCAGTSGWVDSVWGPNVQQLCKSSGLLASQPMTGQALVQFYKTAQTTGSGSVGAQLIGSFILRNNQSAWMWPEAYINLGALTVTTVACSVTNSALSVTMGTVQKRAFRGAGTGPGDSFTRTLTIPLNCNAGTRVNVQIDGSVQDAANGVLNLTGGTGSATGVGIQLLYNNVPLTLQKPINTGSADTAGTFSIPLQARYYQTGSDITPGTANATATFTITYQ